MSEKCYIHVDLDAFYAAVEQLDNPAYRGKPLIVGGLPTEKRGVVSTCSYEARAYGIHSAMPIATAYKLCPEAIFLRGRMKRYLEKSKEVMSVFNEFSPDVHQISVDEAFIDISGTQRLFGDPEQVAQMLKKRVYEKTELTVSVGLASTKYIAKISSGLKKPDGLFIVPPGYEESFMLQLPIKKIWGIGEKTLTRLKDAGFLTTKDIHKASESLLKSLFGESTGSFLYSAVRGNLVETFNASPKSKSISSETTFSLDLTEKYAIESALIELSWDVMFRLFSEQWTTKTVHLKIRYEDFSTVSIQETTTRNISSADDLFMRVKRLFEKKYENGRGIRLLGIAAQNLEDSRQPIQQELFDFGDKKKLAVEKTVIEMQKKNPNITIKKARLMKNSFLLLFIILCSFIRSPKIFSQDLEILPDLFNNSTLNITSPTAIFDIGPEDQDVEFYAQGTWEASFSNFINFSSSTNSSEGISFSFDPPVFIQKTDLTVWFLLQNTWYFEANVADNYDESTIAAGYYGANLLKHARIGNRYITFPDIYGVTDADKGVGSSSNEAPGIMASWAGEDWRADFLLRYDLTEQIEKTWVGQNESSETIINLGNWEKGARFVVPENFVQNITAVYIESDSSNDLLYEDSNGLMYKKLSSSQYLLIPSKNMIVLNESTSAGVLIEFTTAPPDLGSYNDSSSFLGITQRWFGSYDLANYTIQNNPNSSDDFFTKIDGKDAIILQKENYFSPFSDASLYSLSSFSQVDSVSILSESTRISSSDYGVVLLDSSQIDIPGFTNTDYFDEKMTYMQTYTQNRSATTNDASSRFPFANELPLVYLNPTAQINKVQNNSDLIISVINYNETSVLNIGRDAIIGSINVYRNGIKENLFRYDNNTGIVTLSSSVGNFDTIRITWRESTDFSTNGSLSTAIGFEKKFYDNFSMNVSSSLLWPIFDSNSFTDQSLDANASINIAYAINYTDEEIKLKNTLSTSFLNPDTTNAYRISSMDDNIVNDVYLTQDAILSLPNNFTPTLNGRPNEVIPNPPLSSGSKGELNVSTTRISEFNGYIISSDWEINNQNDWISFGINFNGDTSMLASSETVSLWLKTADLPTNYRIYLQLGVSDNETQLFEAPFEIPTWELTSTSSMDVVEPFNRNDSDWQKVEIMLQDEDRAKLELHQNARIIIQSGSSGIIAQNTSIGPFEVRGSTFSKILPSNTSLNFKTVKQVDSNKPELTEMSRFNIGQTNYVHQFSWDTGVSLESVSAVNHMDALPINSYKLLTFFAYVPEINDPNSSMKFILERPTEYGSETSIELYLKEGLLSQLQNSWNKIELDLFSEKLYINNNAVSESIYDVIIINTDISPTKLTLSFFGNGEAYIDEIFLSEAIWEFAAENLLDIEWSLENFSIKSDEFVFIGSPELTSVVSAGISTPINLDENTAHAGLIVDSNAKVDILGFTTEGSIIFSSSNQETYLSNQNELFFIESAGHKIRTTPFSIVTQVLSLEEDFRYVPSSNSATKVENFQLNFLPLGLNLDVNIRSEGEQIQNAFTQDMIMKSTFEHDFEQVRYSITSDAQFFQTGYTGNLLTYSYGNSWLELSKLQFSIGSEQANKRATTVSLAQELNFQSMAFSPSLHLEGSNIYTSLITTEITSTDLLRYSFPFTINNNTFTASWLKKSFLTSDSIDGGNYIEDAALYIKNIPSRSWAYFTIPFYDLFDNQISNKMITSTNNLVDTTSTGYTSEYSFSWQRKNFSNIFDIILPTKASVSVSRDIRATTIDLSDIVQFASNIDFLAFNILGRFSAINAFSWYEQEEFIQSIRLSYSSDKNGFENKRLDLSGYNQLTFYLANNESIRTLIEGRVDTDSEWGLSVEGTWMRRGKSSIILDGLIIIFPLISETQQGIDRENTIHASFTKLNPDNESGYIEQIYGVNHNIEAHVTDFASIAVDLGLDIIIQNESFNILNTITLSGKLQF